METAKISFTVDDLPPLLGISRSGIYDLIRRKALKARKIGRRTVVLKTDLDAFLEALPEAEVA